MKYAAPLGVIPVFVKAGAIVPRNKPVQYAGERQDKDMELVVYTGTDADFVLYEDDQETYAYEQGEYCAIGIRWDEKKHMLSLEACKGKTDYLLPCRFRVKVLYPQKGGEIRTEQKDILYTGEPLKLKFN